MGKNNTKIESWGNKYERQESLGQGGNAEVHLVLERKTQKRYALKQLTNTSRKKRSRFRDEIRVMSENKDIEGGIPIVDSNAEECWYVMPVAEPVLEHLKNVDNWFGEVTVAIQQLTKTLKDLQNRNIAHRDIKPDNICYYNNRYCFGDFGLANFPDHILDLTTSERTVGAKFTIAPEMKRDPLHSDGLKADIYSLAKTFWIMLTNDKFCFEGVYDPLDDGISLRYNDKLNGKHLVELERLLSAATSNAPEDRPSMEQFAESIDNWIVLANDINSPKTQKSEWQFIADLIFGEMVPRTVIWDKLEDIIQVLQLITSTSAYNHMLFPDQGGLDLQKVRQSTEVGWVDLITDFGQINRVHPKTLQFESFGENDTWNYFRLELYKDDYVLYDPSDFSYETLVEDDPEHKPGHYVNANDWCYHVYDYDTGVPLPENAQRINRYRKGVFLVVMKIINSDYIWNYNSVMSAYDGLHSKFNGAEFREYIQAIIEASHRARINAISIKIVQNMSDPNNIMRLGRMSDDDIINERILRDEQIKDILKKNIMHWQFPVLGFESASPQDSRSMFYLCNKVNSDVLNTLFGYNYLCVNGMFNNSRNCDLINCLFVDGKQSAQRLKQIVVGFIINKLSEVLDDVLEVYVSAFFTIELKRGKKSPTHLFTQDEILDEMKKANDRVTNVLVIDDDGYAHIISRLEDKELYPVTIESWSPRNNFVGKYSSFDELMPAYLSALEGWLDYLQTGNHVYSQYSNEYNERELINDIEKYYLK